MDLNGKGTIWGCQENAPARPQQLLQKKELLSGPAHVLQHRT